jgi:hypothetical protein
MVSYGVPNPVYGPAIGKFIAAITPFIEGIGIVAVFIVVVVAMAALSK